MEGVERIGAFLARVTSDPKLGPSHISICTVLCNYWIKNKLHNPFKISRKYVMKGAGVKSTSTYHKILKDLVALEYVNYKAFFDPKGRCEVSIFCELRGRTP